MCLCVCCNVLCCDLVVSRCLGLCCGVFYCCGFACVVLMCSVLGCVALWLVLCCGVPPLLYSVLILAELRCVVLCFFFLELWCCRVVFVCVVVWLVVL